MNIPMTQAVGTSHAQPRMDCENSHQVLRSFLRVTQDQIDTYALTTRPTKETDSRKGTSTVNQSKSMRFPRPYCARSHAIVLLNMLTTMRWSEPGRSKRPNGRRSPGSQNICPDLNHLFGPRGTA